MKPRVKRVHKEPPKLPSTTGRVAANTADEVNEKIRRRTEQNVARFVGATPEAIDRRLQQLNHEWDIERTLEANAATLALTGLVLGATVDRKWFIFPGVITAFLLQHAIQGWCPPVPLLRRMGVRTATEIDEERYALKMLRGDFRHVSGNGEHITDVAVALAAARR